MKNKKDRFIFNKELIPRERLDKLFNMYLDSSVITVIAGSGYGKTQAVSSWTSKLDCPVIWMNLSSFDNDLNHFYQNFIESAEIEVPEVAAILKKINITIDDIHKQHFMLDLSQRLYKYEKLIFVIDNYEVIENEYVKDFIDSIVEAKIDNLTIVVISNNVLSLKAKKFHRFVRQHNITADDLKFTFSEAKELFEIKGINLTDDRIKKIVDETDGWPIAINLMIMNMLNNSKDEDGDEKTLLDIAFQLFQLKFDSNYDEKARLSFILLSMFNGFTKEIVDLLDIDGITMDLYQKNMFTVYDYEKNKYYFHTLFREFLKTKLKTVDNLKIKKMYHSAGKYYYSQQEYYEALEYFSKAGDHEKIVDCVYQLLKINNNSVNVSNSIKKLIALPSEYIKKDSRVNSLLGICYLLTDSHEDAYDLLISVAALKNNQLPENDLEQEVYFALGILEFINNDPACTVYLKLCEDLSLNETIIKSNTINHLLNPASIFLYDSWLATEYGTLESTLNLVDSAMIYFDNISDRALSGFEDLYRAKIYFVRGEFDDAIQYSSKAAVKTVNNEDRHIFIDTSFLRMQAMIFKGDYNEFKTTYQVILNEYESKNVYPVLNNLKLIESWMFSRFGDLEKKADIDRYNMLRKQFYEDTREIISKDLIIYAYTLIRNKEYSEALGIASSIEDEMYKYGEKWMNTLRAKITKAVCYYGLKQKDKSYKYLYEAYEMTHNNRIITPFLEIGSQMRSLMINIDKSTELKFDKEWVDTVRKKSSYCAKYLSFFYNKIHGSNEENISINIKLSKREREVIQLLAQGFKVKEIAQQLYVSESTAKTHINNIYRKFGAVNRAEAVHFATVNKIIQ